MLGVVATLKVKPGWTSSSRPSPRSWWRRSTPASPGASSTPCTTARRPGTYVFMERYVDQAAVEAHRATEHFKTLGRKMGEFMDGRPEVLRLKEVE